MRGLWRNPDFLRLWVGEVISHVGTQVTQLAFPLTAAVTLNATPVQMGVLGAVQFAPFLLFGLFAGAWVDRMHRRPILIRADVGRALLLATIPVAGLAGVLGMEQLYVVAFLVGVLTVFFDVAYQSYLPSLVSREDMVEGNSKLEIGRSIGQIGGPGLGGLLVQALTAPIAVAVDAGTFVVSALALAGIRREEQPLPPRAPGRSIWNEIGEGLQYVFGSRYLLPIAGCTATSNFFSNMAFTVFVLYATRELGLDAATLGLIFTVGSIGVLVAATTAARVARTLGVGPTILLSIFVAGAGNLLVALAEGPGPLTIGVLMTAQALGALGGVVYNITQVSLRQTITPHALQGRMNASMRFIVWGTIPIGALVGGFLGERIGLRPTILVGGVGALFAAVWVLLSPVRSLREQPAPAD